MSGGCARLITPSMKYRGTISSRPIMPARRKTQRAKRTGGGLLITVHRVHGECRQADGDVLGAIGFGRGVLDPFASMRDYSLSRADIEFSGFGCHAKQAAQNDGELVEVRSLPWLNPALWTAHVGNADGRVV